MSEAGNAVIDIQIDAFVLNEAVVEGGAYRIAPITQPDYSYLSLDQRKVHADILRPVDLQNTLPARYNSRLYDLGTGKLRENRVGVYVHWVLPTVYRTGEQQTETRRGRDLQRTDQTTTPQYKPVPNRWLVVRRIKDGTAKPAGKVPEYDGWVVESDRLRDVTQLTDDIDTQVDVSPYVGQSGPHQGRDFIGYKANARGWSEDAHAERIDLTVMSSSSQLFADYQPHNGNVFSLVDNFAYSEGGSTHYLEEADASYFVFGWHAEAHRDPLFYSGRGRSTLAGLLDRLDKKRLHLKDDLPAALFAGAAPAAEDDGTARIVEAEVADDGNRTACCGTIHSVKWRQSKPEKIPAEAAAALFRDPENVPISIGTGPLDALLTYLHVQKEAGHDMKDVEELILKIQTLLISQDDGVDAQAQAEDELRNTDYDRFEGGVEYNLAGETDEPAEPPSQEKLDILRQANAVQAKLDSLRRTLPKMQWALFEQWWHYLCDRGTGRDEAIIKADVESISTKIATVMGATGFESINGSLPALVQHYLESVGLPHEAGAARRYNQQRDPTMLIAGMESGWPSDHLEETSVAMGTQLKAVHRSRGQDLPPASARDVADLLAVIPEALKDEADMLANTYIAFGDGSNSENQPVWDGQPWCPLFLEWEVEYFHIPMTHGDDKLWELDSYVANKHLTTEHVRWGIKKGVDLTTMNLRDNMRTIDGRVLLLPQPAFSLSSKVDQLFTNIPPTLLEDIIPEAEREKLVDGLLNSFPYMSAPLAGLTDHLLTIAQGTHIKPNINDPSASELKPMQEALMPSIGIEEEQLAQIGEESGATPYSNLVLDLGENHSPFKPATHGQLRFTKINIVDKFGQAISVIDQSPAHHPPPMYPCISEMYSCQALDTEGEKANTVITEPEGKCQFVQVPPKINQPARLNAEFLVQDKTSKQWRPADDWENPIIGFIIVNFADYGLQIYMPDGRFYREVRLGGAAGTTISQPWLPFVPPGPDEMPETNVQLEEFITQLQTEKSYLEAVYTMVISAFESMQAAPGSYAEFLSALIGKPVALTNIGYSVELATEPNKIAVLNPKGTPEALLTDYRLPLKIGDRNRFYDGLVGYYEPGKPSTIWTHFPGTTTNAHTKKIGENPDNYPVLQPFYPLAYNVHPTQFVPDRDAHLTRFVALVDPFVPLHGYTGVLAVEKMQLPTWTVETALKRMTAFFHLGPVMATKDIPNYDGEYQLKANYDPQGPKAVFPGKGLAIPANLTATDWMWLQPYDDAATGTKFMGVGLDRLEEVPSWQPAPYTAVEGYLQLRRTMKKDDVDPENPEARMVAGNAAVAV